MSNTTEKFYTFTTFNTLGEEIETYRVACFTLNEAKEYAKNIVGNSRDNEASHGKIRITINQKL